MRITDCAGSCRKRSHPVAQSGCARWPPRSSPGWSTQSPPSGIVTSSPISPAAIPHQSSALLGAPSEDRQKISDWVDDIKKLFEWNVTNDGPAILAAWDQLDAYLEELIARRRASLSDDLISELIRCEDNGDRLSHSELLMLCATLLGAGTDTTRNQLAAAVQVLSAHPEQWALLAQHPELATNAVHELMRYCPIIFGSIRQAGEDVELAGVRIPAGTVVLANTAAANRDPDVYNHPDRLDITREDPPPMLTFGGGVHYCLGSHLARLELTEALRVITQRMPNPRRSGPAPWKGMAGITGPTTLPLEFDVTTVVRHD